MRYQVVECAPVKGSIWYNKIDQWYAIEDTQTGELLQSRYMKRTKANDVCEVMNKDNGEFIRKGIGKKGYKNPMVSRVARFLDNELFVGQKLPRLDRPKKRIKKDMERAEYLAAIAMHNHLPVGG